MIHLETKLKEKNLRLTESRKLLFKALNRSKKSLSPKDLHTSLKEKTDLASIYRNILLFKELGIVHSLSEGTYSICQHQHSESESHSHPHIHIIVNCTQCSRTEEIKEHNQMICKASNELKKLSKTLSKVSSIVLQGQCSKCG